MFDFDSEEPLEALLAFSVLLLVIWVLLSVFGLPRWLRPEDITKK